MQSQSRISGAYFFWLQALPPGLDWQTLKDDLRKVLVAEPGWVNVTTQPRGRGGDYARFSVKSLKDGDLAYDYLTKKAFKDSWVIVHRFDLTGPEPVIVACNCAQRFPGTSGHFSPSNSTSSFAPTEHIIANARSIIMNPGVIYAPNAAAVASYVNVSQAYYPTHPPALAAPAPATYYVQPYHTPVSHYPVAAPPLHAYPQHHHFQQPPVVLTEARGVFISDIDYEARKTDVERLLATVARPVSLDMPPGERRERRRNRGHATAKFESAYDATRVIKILNGAKLMSRNICIRHDRETDVIEPLVVNGTGQRKVY